MERDEFLRTAWRVTVAAQIDPKQLVFVDEIGTNTSLHSLYAWSKRGKRAYCSVSRNRGKNTTLLASMSAEGMGPSIAVVGVVDSQVFEAYLEQVLVPYLRPGQIVVMDNLSGHKGQSADRGSELRVTLSSAILARSEPHRGSLQQDQEHPSQGRG